MAADTRDLLRPLKPNHWQIIPYKHFLLTLVRKMKPTGLPYMQSIGSTHPQVIHLITAQH